ncbi:MAG: hypothetical protein GX325_10065, partial [Peptococcaceae bacterium]|nr:hypothetical protein [Peptococcaceae bacterium]
MSIKREVKDKVKTRWGFVVVFFCLALIFVMASRPMPTYADSGAPGDTVLEVMVSRGLVNINEPFQLTIIAKDGNGNIVENYTGKVCFTSTDSEAVLPGDYTFTTVDQGQKTFDVILKTVGNHNITVTDNNHLIGYWDCNEGSGTVAYDSSGSSNDAVFSGTGGWSTVVPPGSLFANGHSLDLNGADKTFVANPPTMKVDNLTMTAWFYPREACTTGGKCIIYNGDSSYTGYGLLIEEGKLVFMCGGKSLISINSAQLTQNQWHHVALVRSNGTWSVYHNGERQGLDSSLAPNPLDKEGYPPKFFSMAMNALIDDVRFYDRPLSEEEVGLLASGNHLLKTATTGDIRVKQRTGTGAEVDPYLILTAGDLDDVRYNMSAYYKQMEDIELAGQGDWEPIGDESNPFQGHYDGNGQTIYGLQINDDSLVDVGLFGYVGSTGELKNIRLVGIDINSTKPGVHAGGLVGTNRGTIDNCQSAGKVEANVDNQEVAYAGLLVGRNGPEGTITASSSNSGSVETNRAAGAAGGLAGISQGTIERSSNAAQVLDGKYSGGLVGCASGGGTIDGGMTIDDCDNAGNISGLYGGGLIGYIESGPGKITAGRNMGVINGTTAAGGVCGYDATGKIIIENSSNTGNIGSTTYAGGLLGYIGESEELNISNCFNQGVVSCPGTGGGGGYAGGLVGYAGAVSINKGFNTGPVSGRLAGGLLACTDNNNDKRTTISQSYNTGGVTGSFGFGGLVAFDLGPLDIINCYNRGATTQAYAGGAEFYEGGLVARLWNASSITNSYSAAKLERPFYTSFGGLVGDINPQATTTGCYFNNDLAGISRHNGAGTLSNTAAMQAKATYTSWDFEDVWKIMDGVTYPIFQWQPWSDGEKMLADQRALTWQMIKGENLTENNVTTNLLLPGTGAEGSDITWSVEPTEYAQYIDVATGAIMAKPDNDVNITLKAAIKSGAAGPIYKEFLLTLKSKTPKYVLTYDANGGTGDPPPPAQYTAGESLTVAQCGLTNPYKVFKEWNTKADGRGESYQEGAGIIMPPYDLTLYAIWNVHWENGDGSKENPYLIENAEHIRAIPDLMAGEGIAYFKQVGDIDLSAYPNWAPIGSADNPFLDVYNGDGKTIANLTINTNNVADVGLFGCLGDTGRLENIKLQAVNINAQGADVHAGGLVGRNKGTVTGCSSGGNVIANGNNTQAAHAGILAGFNDTEGEISHCSSSGSVKSNRTAGAAGGLAGTGNGTIENSDNTAGVEGRFAGGLVGRVLDSGQLVVKTSHNAGQISGTNAGGLVGYTNTGPLTINEGYNLGPIDGQFAGGLVGYIYGARVEVAASYNNEKVTATSLGGGLIGHCFDDGTLNISKSYNQGEISSASYGGGLAGYMPKGEIENSYNTGSVSGASYAGGLVGMMLNGEISYSHNIGQVIGGSSGKGGLVGTKSDGAVNASYYDAEKSGQNDTGKGEPLTTAAMKEKDSFSGWDFNEVWMMVENQSCPLLQNQLVMVFYELTRWDAIKGGNYAPDNITVDLNLVQQITETFTIAWSVDPEQGNLINTGTGKITRPTKDTEIRLAATLMRDGQVCTGVGPVEHTLVIKSGDALYTVTFDGNGAEEEPLVKQFAPDVEIILPEQGAFTFQYMKIKEWNTRLDGSGDTLTTAYKMPPHDLVFYAIWEPDWQGEGSEENPYQVESAAHLDDLRQKMAGQEGIVHFIQVADIDLGSYENWAPIGDSGNPFNGVFNGNNKTISNLKIRNAATDYAGLFGYVGTTGELKDITLNNIDIDVNRANARVGGLAGASLGTISGCSIAGTIKGSGAGGIAGGLAGVCAGTITNSSNAANVTAVNYVGGLTGHVDTEEISIIGSHNTGMVKGTGTAGSCGGGLVGYTGSASVTMTDCYNGGSVTQVRYCGGLSGYLAGGSINIAGSYNRGAVSSAVTGSYSGGLVGFVNSGTVAITDCGNESEVVGLNVAGGLIGYNVTGSLTISGSYNWGNAFSNIYTGGLLGYIKGTGTAGITNSYNTGEVEAKDTGGGLVGYTVSNNSITISQCYNTAAVIGTNYAGGLTGCLRGGDQITDSYNTGRVTGANTGGLVGKKEGGAVSGSYYDRETSGQGDENKGIPLTTAQMKQQESFAGWDFNNTWRIIEGGTYPKLTWQVLQDEDFIDAFYALTSWKNIKRDNYALNNITGDLNLAQKITETFTIAWGIDPEQGNLINTGTGEITKPGEDTEIRLTATLMRDGQVCADVEPVEHTLVIKSGNALYTVTFDGNGAAEEPLEKQFAPGDDIIVPGPSEFTFQHLVIKEWNTGLDGSGDTLTDACKMPAHDIVFYAIWEPDWQGDGSENNPYQVASVAHLDDLRQKMNEDEGVLYFAQTEDIDLDACESWLPIGDAANPFKGVYRGNDKSITGLTINDSALADIG